MTPRLRASAFHEAGHFVGYCILGRAVPQSIEVVQSAPAAYSGRVSTVPGARALLNRGGLTPEERCGEALGVCRVYAAGRVAEEKAAADDYEVMLAGIGWLKDQEDLREALQTHVLPFKGHPSEVADQVIQHRILPDTHRLYGDPVVWEAVELVAGELLSAENHWSEPASVDSLGV